MAHNISFDSSFLLSGLQRAFPRPAADVAAYYGIANDQAHRALADVIVAHKAYWAMATETALAPRANKISPATQIKDQRAIWCCVVLDGADLYAGIVKSAQSVLHAAIENGRTTILLPTSTYDDYLVFLQASRLQAKTAISRSSVCIGSDTHAILLWKIKKLPSIHASRKPKW